MTATLPETMNAWVLHGQTDARFETVPVPRPAEGEVLIRVDAALTCGTDLKVWRRGYHARMIQPPAVFGHEFAGRVVLSNHPGWQAGDRIVAANSAPCGACYFCGLNLPNLCEDLLFVNGAYAEYLCLPERIVEKNCLAIPDGLSAVKAALVEPLACAVKGVDDAGVAAGDKVLVIGAGPLGLMLARVCVLRGAEVTCVDGQPERLAVARELGAARTEAALLTPGFAADLKKNTTAHGYGYDCVIEAIGRAETWQLAPQLVRPGGRVNLFGGCPSDTELHVDATRLHYEEIKIVASFHHTPETVREALALIAREAVPALALIREGRAFADLPEVFEELRAGKASPKTAILPNLSAGARVTANELAAMA